MKATKNQIPRHIGIILDGNRRFSKRLMMKPWKGHEWGAKKVEKLFDWCKEFGVKELTLYAFSYENFDRPKKEFDFLMNLFVKEFTRLAEDERLEKDRIRVNFIGRIQMFPEKVREKMHKLMDITKKNNGYIINFAMAYGGRTEVVDAAVKIAKQVKEGKLKVDKINEEVFAKNLYMSNDPDLVIRTGAAIRTSNFLLWQSAYSEFIFLEKFWPEFEKEDFVECIAEYGRRDRRFGK